MSGRPRCSYVSRTDGAEGSMKRLLGAHTTGQIAVVAGLIASQSGGSRPGWRRRRHHHVTRAARRRTTQTETHAPLRGSGWLRSQVSGRRKWRCTESQASGARGRDQDQTRQRWRRPLCLCALPAQLRDGRYVAFANMRQTRVPRFCGVRAEFALAVAAAARTRRRATPTPTFYVAGISSSA